MYPVYDMDLDVGFVSGREEEGGSMIAVFQAEKTPVAAL